MLIPALTKFTEFLYISCRKKITAIPVGASFAGARGICPLCPLFAAIALRFAYEALQSTILSLVITMIGTAIGNRP